MKRILKTVQEYLVFFLLTAFIVTCCMTLFLSVLSATLSIDFTEENITSAAKITFLNVLLLTFLFTLIDRVRRRLTVEKPLRTITDAAEKMMQGDFSVCIDLSEIRHLNEGFYEVGRLLNRMSRELQSIETLRTGFVADVSHEIKSPLAVLQNYAVLLSKKELSEEKRNEYTGAIRAATARLSDLIGNILRLNKLENQEIFPENTRYDLGEQLSEIFLSFEYLWEEKGIEIETDLEDGVMIESDRELLSHVFQNLFSNAFKFTDRGGRVSLFLTKDEEMATVSVADTGCGIGKEVGAHIFDKFYQGDPSHATEGNGLGLALVHRVIEIVGGEIFVDSEMGRGSTFTVRLPLRKEN